MIVVDEVMTKPKWEKNSRKFSQNSAYSKKTGNLKNGRVEMRVSKAMSIIYIIIIIHRKRDV